MFWILGTTVIGMCIGYLLRNRQNLFSHIRRLILWIIYLSLFAMGLSVGSNDLVMDNLGGLGVRAIVISLVGTVGSVFLSWLLYRYLFVPGKKRD